MKYRSDFVTNSSSSSFVVAFKTRPKSIEEVQKLLFGDEETVDYMYNYNNEQQTFSTLDMATVVFNDIKSQKANNKKEISEAFSGHMDGSPDFDDFKIPGEDKNSYKSVDWKAYTKAFKEFNKKKTNEFMNKFKNFKIYCFEYSDNEGAKMCQMEHGDIFKNLNHIKISKH